MVDFGLSLSAALVNNNSIITLYNYTFFKDKNRDIDSI